MPSLDHIRDIAEKISGNPDNGTIRTFIDQLMEALQPEHDNASQIVEQREQQRLH